MTEERKGEKSHRRRDRGKDWENFDEEDSTQLERLWGKAKGFAKRKKEFLPTARYSLNREDNEDQVELLEVEEELSTSFATNGKFRHGGHVVAGKGLFDDI